MAVKTWVGGTSNALGTGANWDGAAEPDDGDTLIFNHRSAGNNPCTSGCDAGTAGDTYPKVIVSEGYKQQLGASGDPLDPAAITELYWQSGHEGTSYIDGTSLVDGTFQSPVASNVVEFKGEAQHIALNSGQLHLVSGFTIANGDQLIEVSQSTGVKTRLTIDSGLTFTGSEVHATGGEIVNASTLIDLHVSGDAVVFLRDAAAVTGSIYIDDNATVYWDSSGTLAMVHVKGGKLVSRSYTLEKTLSELHMYGDAQVDLRGQGGDIITLTKCCVHGKNMPLLPPGTVFGIT